MKYYFAYKIQYQEVDNSKHLRLYTLENLLLNVSGRVADYLGYGLKYFFNQQLSWIITRLNLTIKQLPSLSDIIVVETWIESNIHTVSIRNFRIYVLTNKQYHFNDIDRNDHGKPSMLDEENFVLVGEAKSYWTLLHLQTRTMVNAFDQPIFASAVDGQTINVPRVSKLLHDNPSSDTTISRGERTYRVKYSDIDYNMHCNSCKYIEMMFDTYVYPNFQECPITMEVNYRKELSQNTQVVISYEKADDRVVYKITDENGDSCCTAAFLFAP